MSQPLSSSTPVLTHEVHKRSIHDDRIGVYATVGAPTCQDHRISHLPEIETFVELSIWHQLVSGRPAEYTRLPPPWKVYRFILIRIDTCYSYGVIFPTRESLASTIVLGSIKRMIHHYKTPQILCQVKEPILLKRGFVDGLWHMIHRVARRSCWPDRAMALPAAG